MKGMVIKQVWKAITPRSDTVAAEPIKTTHHAHSHCYHNPGLITPSLYRDLVASDFRNYFYFANFCEQAAVCT